MSDKPDPKISVVLPTYNRSKVLGRAIRSVLQQSFRDFELIVVDDGSTDDTEEVVRAFSDERVIYIRQTNNAGASAARNVGIQHAKAHLVAFQDSDDEWLSDKLKQQYELIDDNASPEIGIVYTGFVYYTDRTAHYIPEKNTKQISGNITDSVITKNFVSTQTMMIKKAHLIALGGFDEELAKFEDWDLVLRLTGITTFAAVDTPQVIVNFTPNSISSYEVRYDLKEAYSTKHIVEKNIELFRKYPDVLANNYYKIGRILQKNGRYREAVSAFRESLTSKFVGVKSLMCLLFSLSAVAVGKAGPSGQH